MSLKNTSVIVALLSLALAAFSLLWNYQEPRRVGQHSEELKGVAATLERTEQLFAQATRSTASETERKLARAGLRQLQHRIDLSQARLAPAKPTVDPSTAVWIKLGFSVFFGLAAMYMVLSRKYDDETKKWAFSVLTLISGVWIGTVS